jgi:hypothetical protein
MDIIIEAAATSAFIIGFFFGPAMILEVYRTLRG